MQSKEKVVAAISLLGVTITVAAALWKRCTLAPGPDRLSWNRMIFGHRGCRGVPGIVENTLPAYEYALARGADGIEIDVRLCKTGELVVIHDAETRLQFAGPNCPTSDLTYEGVHQLKFTKPTTAPARVPELNEVLELCLRRKAKLLLEVKHYSLSKTHAVVTEIVKLTKGEYRSFMYSDVTIISFNPYICYCLRRADPNLAVCPIYDDATISGIAYGSCDVSAWRPLQFIFPRLLDKVFFWFCDTCAAEMMGASMVGTHVKLATPSMCNRHYARKRLVYLWGVLNGLPEDLKNSTLCASCDDDHDVLKSSVSL